MDNDITSCQESVEWNTGIEYWNGLNNTKNLCSYSINSWINDTDYQHGIMQEGTKM